MAQRFAVTIGVVALSLSGLTGCKRVGQEVAREVVQATSPAVKPKPLVPPAEEEAKAFAEAMQKAVDAGDASAIEPLIDFPLIVDRALAGVHLPKVTVEQTAKGVATGAREAGLVHQLSGMRAAGTAVTLLGTRLDRQGRWASFRALPAAGGFEHYEFLLTRRDDKSVVAADVFFLSSAELMSAGMRRMLIGAFAADKNFLERLSAQDNLFVKHVAEIQKVGKAQAAGAHDEALALLDRLPQPLHDQKFALLMRLQSTARNPDDPRYAACVARLIEKYPDDQAALIASIDHHFLQKDYAKALAAVHTAEKRSTQDAYFGVLKVNGLVAMNKLAAAKAMALQTIEREAGLLPAHLALVSVLLLQRDHAATAERLLQMRDQFALTYQFDGVPEYAAFVASPEYPAFKRKLDALGADAR